MFDFSKIYNMYFEVTNEFFQGKKIEDIKEKSQYFTPIEEVEKMIDDLNISKFKTLRILDPSCGNGILLFKILEKIFSYYSPQTIIIDVYDIDINLLNNVKKIMETIIFTETKLSIRYINEDFLKNNDDEKYDYIIMNPPYKKINVQMVPENLKGLLYGQPNLYHLFITKALDMLEENGVLCILSPKNYLSGKYTEKLRQYIVSNFSIIKIHTFNDRKTVFGNNITQEICIIHIKKAHDQNVLMSYNGNAKFKARINEIILENDTKIIYTPRSKKDYKLIKRFEKFPFKTIGKEILMKTGKIVQFRINGKEINLKDEEFFHFQNGIPLIVYRHISTDKLKYQPLIGKTKNKAITLLDDKSNNSVLIKNSNYVLIRKNIDKNYDKLIHCIGYLKELKSEMIALDNGIAYFTNNDDSLTEEEVLGLQCILMSKQFDDYYRMINSSHTINVYELENMHFPDLEIIRLIGRNIILNSLTLDQCTEIFEQYLK
ncbi:Eco57I restriction-modification methylase domain-containing protein [Clostridium tagluense]|uniref:Eco57I restriction-modification methylase domain-containing protein n=1 Tax=Clostridium tagluense TaxID=360422 RepID=UPI001CF1010D|nr:Eco57I restriction-modification methylase domain-containing protein [Clostridium tagluense]MCB2300862.1 Eco57I restriction-modification methylase domain-containing protein [Clostridium tagluense]